MRVKLHAERCIGSGLCNIIAPDVFSQDDDGHVLLLQESPDQEHHDAAREAAKCCPSETIEVDEERGAPS
jgi:ferredoxin